MMLTSEDNKTVNELVMQLCLFERNFKNSSQYETGNYNQEALALQQKRGHKAKSVSKPNKTEDSCHYCKKKGHWIKDCKKWIADGRHCKPKLTTSINHSNVALHVVSNEINYVTSSDEWWIDNGATRHVTNSEEFFTDYEVFNVAHTIQAAGKEELKAIGKGTVKVISKINDQEFIVELKDVWHVPNISRNLFSILAAHDRNPLSQFKSFPKECRFMVNNKTMLIGYRQKNGSLYKASIQPIKRQQVNAVEGDSTLQLYNEGWGHQDKQHVKQKLEKELGIKVKSTSDICEACAYGKSCRLSFGRRETATSPGELISADICGPFPRSFQGYKYLVGYKDDYIKYRFGYISKSKSDVKDSLLEVIANAKNQGHSVKTFLTDNGGEFVNANVKRILASNGINHKLTAPYTPQQNGGVERENRTIIEMARTFKYSNPDVEFPESLWAEFVKTAIYILNRTGKSSIIDISPYQLWYGTKPRIRHLRIIGSTCFAHVPSQMRRKMDKKAQKGFLVGYDGDERYRIFIKETNKVQLSRDVKFIESKYLQNALKKSTIEKDIPSNDIQFKIQMQKEANEDNEGLIVRETAEEDNEEIQNQPITEQVKESESQVQEKTSQVRNTRKRKSEVDNGPNSKCLRNRTIIISNSTHSDIVMMSKDFVDSTESPSTYDEAVKSEQKKEWINAMKEEINSLAKNNTWILESLPKGCKALPSKWVFKIKTNADGSIEKYKARLVIKGFKQKYGVDYDQTYSPVAKMSSIRSLISIAATENMHLMQFDVSTAFLYGKLDEIIYMNQPE